MHTFYSNGYSMNHIGLRKEFKVYPLHGAPTKVIASVNHIPYPNPYTILF